MAWVWSISLFPRLSKGARGEEEESLVSAVYACASITQILAKPYSVRAVINNNCAQSAVEVLSAAVMAGSSDTFSSALSYALELYA